MFSKALFKQSWKANKLMWTIITVAVCFMLSCVMVISGSGNIGDVATEVEDTIITKEIDAAVQKRAISYYSLGYDGESKFDSYYAEDFSADSTTATAYAGDFQTWLNAAPVSSSYASDEEYNTALASWKGQMPAADETVEKAYAYYMSAWLSAKPEASSYSTTAEYYQALQTWNASKPEASSLIVKASAASAYAEAVASLKDYVIGLAQKEDASYTEDSLRTKEMLGTVMYTINPNHAFDSFFTEIKEDIPSDYDVASIISHVSAGDVSSYLASEERISYLSSRSEVATGMFLASNMTSDDVIDTLISALSEYGVTKDKYESYGYDYAKIKSLATETSVSYFARYQYEYGLLEDELADGTITSQSEFESLVSQMETRLASEMSSSLISSLPEEVSSALEEVGKMDLYSLIVGSVFFKMAGLLLPIIYMIMASNNLVVGQVDSGSMAYVLSTSTKRSQVTFTQGLFLILSLFAMFACTTITSCICFSSVSVVHTSMTYGKLVLFNLGAFLVLFAMSGLCFACSCIFNRSKNSMAVGGGLSMFFLVCTMLGLFGSEVIPSVVRFDALNYFNYVSLISLFDAVSIIDGTTDFIWKMAILAGIGLVGYGAGDIVFKKKDLPL